MYLMFYTDETTGERVYTLKEFVSVLSSKLACPRYGWTPYSNEYEKVGPDGKPTESAHPARFSPDDKFSRERVTCKKRFGLLPTQQPPLKL